ncbi:dynactin subunit 2-like isoform X2 [Ptychodera flava]|uniref:dynactin subunit 2-like isoform X2 n=1 Tax=Ptychodera flava TaxID=63121 RepID=UPI003969E06A
MADPKYADLPGIDPSQPDVFETNDLPEDDQEYVPDELNSESVDRIPLNANSAYTRFKGKSLDASSLDFSDRIGKYRKTGYDCTKTEYEMVGENDGVVETPMQRYQRLQHEIRELAENMEKIQTKAKKDSGSEKSPVLLSQQVLDLQDQLRNLHLEKTLGAEPVLDLADPQAQLPKKLLSQLQAYKRVAGENSKTPSKGQPSSEAHVVYELFYKPEQAKFNQLSKMADFEQRLLKIESVLGDNAEKMSILCAETHSKSLLDAVAELQARATVLDPEQLDHVDARIQNLIQRLNTVKVKKKSITDAARESKLSELYDMMERWDSIAETLPKIVERLTSLNELHEQALQFSQALSHLDSTQTQISQAVKAEESVLKKLQDSFASNMAAIQANCASLDERFKKLK